MKRFTAIAGNPCISLAVNLAYAAGNCALGFMSGSWWFITVGAYYAVLAAARFCVLLTRHRASGEADMEPFARQVSGILLVALSVCLAGMNILSAVKDRGTVFHEIIMIAIALYAFTKITLAIIGMAKARKSPSPIYGTLRSISLADAFVSIYSLQRSMLVSFPGMAPDKIQLMNILTGTAVWLILLLLGINLIGGKRINMAKSKLTSTNEKIAEAVTGGYKKIEQGVVDGYKKIEQGVVDGYMKVEDKFIGVFLAKENESIEDARARLKKEGRG